MQSNIYTVTLTKDSLLSKQKSYLMHSLLLHVHNSCIYQCLDHENSPPAKVCKTLIDIERAILSQSLQQYVQQNEGACSTHSSTAVDQERHSTLLAVGLLDPPDEGDEGSGIFWHSMIWPGGEVVLDHCQ